jgi:hypothetical protein
MGKLLYQLTMNMSPLVWLDHLSIRLPTSGTKPQYYQVRIYQFRSKIDLSVVTGEFALFASTSYTSQNGSSGRRPDFGHTGLWRFAETALGVAYWNVRFQFFRTVTNDTRVNYKVLLHQTCSAFRADPVEWIVRAQYH